VISTFFLFLKKAKDFFEVAVKKPWSKRPHGVQDCAVFLLLVETAAIVLADLGHHH
jgi:hypothetical protein